MGAATRLLQKQQDQSNGEIIEFDGVSLISDKQVFSPTVTHCSKFFSDNIEAKDGAKCLEIGIGSGYNVIQLAKRYKNISIYGVDFNRRAVDISRKNLQLNMVDGHLCQSDLFSDIGSQFFDYIYFNPPLIHKESSNMIESAIYDAGGNTMLSFLEQARHYLRDNGFIFILYAERQKDFLQKMMNKFDYHWTTISNLDVGYEKYTVYKLSRVNIH